MPRMRFPFTYNIEYGSDHVDNPDYFRMIADAPPFLLHVGQDVPVKSMWGPVEGYDYFGQRLLTPAGLKARLASLRKHVDGIHGAGVELAIPYICSMFLFGNAEKRTGFWRFYDHWDDYHEFGFGPRPREDPLAWNCEEPRTFEVPDSYVYEPCINRLEWRSFLRTVVRHIASVGYDGVFVDVNSTRCERDCCKKPFRDHLESRYSDREIRDLFGLEEPSDIRLGRQGEGLLWVETVRFRGEMMASLFRELRDEGRRLNDEFLVIPNLSPYAHADGIWTRIGNSQVISAWAEVCPLVMFEETQQPGLYPGDQVLSYAFQYKYALAHGTRAGCLIYNSLDRWGVGIAMAEAASGAGVFIQAGYSVPEVRREYRRFSEAHPELFDGLKPLSRVALLFSYDELAWGLRRHLEGTRRMAEALMALHIPFDIVAKGDLGDGSLPRYDAVIASDVSHLADRDLDALLSRAKRGGLLLAAGQTGAFNSLGRRREGGLAGIVGGGNRVREGVLEGAHGRGRVIMAEDPDKLVHPRDHELFMLSEAVMNDTAKVFENLASFHCRKSPNGILLPLLNRSVPDLQISDCEPTLCFNVYYRSEGKDARLVIHAVNYDLPVHSRGESGPPRTSGDVKVRIRLPACARAAEARAYLPPALEKVDVESGLKEDILSLAVPGVDLYTVVEVKLGHGSGPGKF